MAFASRKRTDLDARASVARVQELPDSMEIEPALGPLRQRAQRRVALAVNGENNEIDRGVTCNKAERRMAPLFAVRVAEHGLALFPRDTPVQQFQDDLFRTLRMEVQAHAAPLHHGVGEQLPDETRLEVREHPHGFKRLLSQLPELGVLSVSLEQLPLRCEGFLNLIIPWPAAPINDAGAQGSLPFRALKLDHTVLRHDSRGFVRQPASLGFDAARASSFSG